MKKIFITILLMICLFSVTGCFNKEKINTNELREKLETNGFVVVDNTEKLEDFPGDSALVATNNSGYAIMLLSFPSVDVAKSSYEKLCAQAEEDNAKTKTVTIGNYSEYTLESKNNYYYILRVDDRILVAYGTVSKKAEIKSKLKELGY